MKYKYVLDSSAWIEFFDGTRKGEKVKKILESGKVATSIITVAELSDKCAREKRNTELFLEFIQAKAAILPLTLDIAQKSGKVKEDLRKVAQKASLADAIHLQTAQAMGAIFVTADSDFKERKGILFLV